MGGEQTVGYNLVLSLLRVKPNELMQISHHQLNILDQFIIDTWDNLKASSEGLYADMYIYICDINIGKLNICFPVL